MGMWWIPESGEGSEEEQAGAVVQGKDISVGEGERGMKEHLPELRQRIWGLLWAANVILLSLCNAPTASSHQYVGLLIASMGIFTPGLMPSKHYLLISSKKNL